MSATVAVLSKVGATVRVSTSLRETIEGTIFTHDDTAGVVVIEQKVLGETKATFRMLKVSAVEEATVLQMPADPATGADGASLEAIPVLPEINTQAIQAREERALAKADEFATAMAVGYKAGVTAHAQAVFDALRKTMPCEWLGQNIVVLRLVQIKPPYTPETCEGDKSALPRVQKVLAGELKRL